MKHLLLIFLFAVLGIIAILSLTGCDGARTLHPAQVRVYRLPDRQEVHAIGSQNTQGTRFLIRETADGASIEFEDKGGQWFHAPDFSGENWLMYAGAAIVVAGIAMFFFPLTSPLALWVAAGGVGLILFGSFLKSSLAPWITCGLIVSGLGYAYYRNRKALRNAVQGIEKAGSQTAKDAVYANTDHDDDRIINGLTRS